MSSRWQKLFANAFIKVEEIITMKSNKSFLHICKRNLLIWFLIYLCKTSAPFLLKYLTTAWRSIRSMYLFMPVIVGLFSNGSINHINTCRDIGTCCALLTPSTWQLYRGLCKCNVISFTIKYSTIIKY